MMKKYIVGIFLLLLFNSCSFLDYDETSGRTKEEAYSYFDNLNQLVAHVYSYLPDDFGRVSDAMVESATDNSIYTYENNAIHYFNNDVWSPMERVDDAWDLWDGIRSANSFLENFDSEVLKSFEYNDNYDEMIEKSSMFPFEVRFLRAFFYFELAKRYGNIPLLIKTYNQNEINSIRQESFDKIIDFIVTECDEIAKILPVNQMDFWGESGRVTKGAALALKSRALLYAASKLHNPSNDLKKWELAAKAAYEVIELNSYSMPDIDKDNLYSDEGGNTILSSPQLIFERRNSSKTNSFEARNQPMGYEGSEIGGGNTPTQNLVDAFEMEDGTPFDWNNKVHVANIYFDESGKPTRDPRLYLNVLHNGSSWLKQTVETFVGGKNEILDGATTTGYYLRKYMNPSVSLNPSKPNKIEHHYVLFRYAEILLNYAEAMNEWKGPDIITEECRISATESINKVRRAAHMNELSGLDQNSFREKVRNERRVELAFEGHRFYDIRRWVIAGDDNVRNIYGIEIVKSGNSYSYEKVLLKSYEWNDKKYLFPIPQHEKYKNENLVQNPGW